MFTEEKIVTAHVPSRPAIEEPIGITPRDGSQDVNQLLIDLAMFGANAPIALLCEIELAHFDPPQQKTLLPLLWRYTLEHRDSNNRDELVAVGAAIRKYVALMPMDQMGELATLLESGHRSSLPIELEIEVAKMVYRNFEVHPPTVADPHPQLAERLWEMAQAYLNPRILVRDKHAAAASLAVEAIVVLRSPLAENAWQAVTECPYSWFSELVSDDLDELLQKWSDKNPEAVAWLSELRSARLVHA